MSLVAILGTAVAACIFIVASFTYLSAPWDWIVTGAVLGTLLWGLRESGGPRP